MTRNMLEGQIENKKNRLWKIKIVSLIGYESNFFCLLWCWWTCFLLRFQEVVAALAYTDWFEDTKSTDFRFKSTTSENIKIKTLIGYSNNLLIISTDLILWIFYTPNFKSFKKKQFYIFKMNWKHFKFIFYLNYNVFVHTS